MQTSVFLYADKLLRFKAPVLRANQLTYLAGVAIHAQRARVAKGLNVNDQPAKPYSDRPVYIPVTGKGRTKTSLRGREVLTAADIRTSKSAGFGAVGKKGQPMSTAAAIRTRKSLKFANRADYCTRWPASLPELASSHLC
jgi:hypothetical protein